MINNESKFIYLKENCLSKEFCEELISKFEESPRKYYGVTSGGYEKSKKNTLDFNIPLTKEGTMNTEYEKELWLSHSEVLTKMLGKHLRMYIGLIHDEYKGIPSFDSLFTEMLLFHKYTKGEGIFAPHCDSNVSKYENNNVKNRIVTYLFYLNDVEEGGETVLCNNIKIKPKAGSLLIFPACWTYPHKGEVPLSSDKYIITGWMHEEVELDEEKFDNKKIAPHDKKISPHDKKKV